MKISKKSFPAPSVADSNSELPFRSLFLHAWDLHDDDAERVMGWMHEIGLNTLCMASTYHSGWFIHPQNSKHRAFMTEGSVCYFHPQRSLYKNVKLRPKVSALAQKHDWFAEAGKRLGKFDLQLVAWTVGTHNTRLGLQFPELAVQNVYGDRLPHALCPANPEVREYLLTLCHDLATNYPLWGIQLEAFGWLGFVHGHHHERDLVGLSPLEQELMGLCVCNACQAQAGRAGVDVKSLAENVKSTLDVAFREAPQRPKGHPASLAELQNKWPDLKKFYDWRKAHIDSLVAHVKQRALAGTNCRLLLQSPFDVTLADVADGFSSIAYGTSPAETETICERAAKHISKDWTGLHQCLVQLGCGVPKSERDLCGIVAAVAKGGCNGVNFYNRSESPPKMLNWLKTALLPFV